MGNTTVYQFVMFKKKKKRKTIIALFPNVSYLSILIVDCRSNRKNRSTEPFGSSLNLEYICFLRDPFVIIN